MDQELNPNAGRVTLEDEIRRLTQEIENLSAKNGTMQNEIVFYRKLIAMNMGLDDRQITQLFTYTGSPMGGITAAGR